MARAEKYVACERLLKTVVRAFFSAECAIVMDVLAGKAPDRMQEAELAALIGLGPRQVREYLNKLLNAHLVRRTIKKEDQSVQIDEEEEKKKNPQQIHRTRVKDFSWFVDAHQVLQVLRYRFGKMNAELSAKAEVVNQDYVCSNPHCPAGEEKYPVLDCVSNLRLAQQNLMMRSFFPDDQFRCPHPQCLSKQESGDVVRSVLVSAERDDMGAGGLLRKMNEQLAKIFQLMEALDKCLDRELRQEAEEPSEPVFGSAGAPKPAAEAADLFDEEDEHEDVTFV